MDRNAGKNAGVFVDRDGTLIKEVGYLRAATQIEILPGVPEAIRLLRNGGLKVAVVTNQSAVARGFITEDILSEIHRELRDRLAERGAYLDGIYYCPHHPTEGNGPYRLECECRKPNAGLARRAAAELGIEFSRSYVVGDQRTDMELAARIGAKGILIRPLEDGGREHPAEDRFLSARDLWEAAQWVVRDYQARL